MSMGEIDRKTLYGDFQEEEVARVKGRRILYDKAKHKALNIPYTEDDSMNVRRTVISNGIGAKGLVAAVLAAGLPLAGLAGLLLWNQMPAKPPVPVVATSPIATAPAQVPAGNAQLDSEWDHVIYTPAELDANGKVLVPEKILDRIRYRSRSGNVEQRQKDGTWIPAPTMQPPK